MSIQTTLWAWEQQIAPDEKLCLLALSEILGDPSEVCEWTRSHAEALLRFTGMDSLGAVRALSSLKSSGRLLYEEPVFDGIRRSYIRFEMDRGRRLRLSSIGPKTAKQPKPGYVYLLKGGGCYKIGKAQNPEKRSETLAIQLPYPVQLIHYIPAKDPRVYESELHEQFADKRLNGEWFDLSDEDVAYIKGLGR